MKTIKKQYIPPFSAMVQIGQVYVLAGSGPGAGDQHDPGQLNPSRRWRYEEEDDWEEEED